MNYRKDKYGNDLSVLGFGCMRFPTTAEGKMSDYRWFFWMVICCSLATFFVTFLAYKRVDPNYGKK